MTSRPFKRLQGRPPARLPAFIAALVLGGLLTACGGGDGKGTDALNTPDPIDLPGPPCSDCVAGHLSGVVATGSPLADAQIRVVDADGRQSVGRTDALGRFRIDVAALQGPLLLQAIGTSGGRAVVLHSLARPAEVGQRFIQITSLTELISARVLGGMPAFQLMNGQVDPLRISAGALAEAEHRTEALVRPVLDAVGVGEVDLRLSSLTTDGKGLDAALDRLVVEPAGTGHAVRAVWQPPTSALAVAVDRADPGTVPAPDASQQQATVAGLQALPAIETRLQAFASLFAHGLPDAPVLQSWLHAGFLHGGLDRAAYIDRVLRREDPAAQGGFSLHGVRFEQPRLLQAQDEDTLLVGFRVVPREPFEPFDEAWWMVRDGAGWRWRGDGQPARLRMRHALVLTAQPLNEAGVRALPGVTCPASTVMTTPCRIDGGVFGTPPGGHVDLGLPGTDSAGQDHFGLMGFYRASAADAQARLAAYSASSRLLAAPSAEVQAHVLVELDARLSDPRAVKAAVRGPGLPPGGLVLRRPASTAGRPGTDHWVWAAPEGTPEDDWHGVPAGWCGGAWELLACQASWSSVGQGSRYTVHLYDAQDQSVGNVQAALPLPPAALQPAELTVPLLARFPRWHWPEDGSGGLTLAWLLGTSSPSGDLLRLQVPWQPPAAAGHRVLHADLAWHRAGFPPTFGQDVRRERLPLSGAEPAGVWDVTVPARAGFRSTWLVLRLTGTDDHGNRFIHALAPSNPR